MDGQPAGSRRPTSLYHPARGHILNYLYTIKITQYFRKLGVPLIVICQLAPRELAHKSRYRPLP